MSSFATCSVVCLSSRVINQTLKGMQQVLASDAGEEGKGLRRGGGGEAPRSSGRARGALFLGRGGWLRAAEAHGQRAHQDFQLQFAIIERVQPSMGGLRKAKRKGASDPVVSMTQQ